MDFDFLRSATASSSAYRVVCGEMIIDSNMWNVHNEVLVAVVRDGYKGVTVWVQILLKVNFANP